MRGPSCLRATQLPFASPQWLFGLAPAAVSLVFIHETRQVLVQQRAELAHRPQQVRSALPGDCSKTQKSQLQMQQNTASGSPAATNVHACHSSGLPYIRSVCCIALAGIQQSPDVGTGQGYWHGGGGFCNHAAFIIFRRYHRVSHIPASLGFGGAIVLQIISQRIRLVFQDSRKALLSSPCFFRVSACSNPVLSSSKLFALRRSGRPLFIF